MCREGVTECMGSNWFCNACFFGCPANCFLHARFIQVMPPDDTTPWVAGHLARREHILPTPFVFGPWIFSPQRARHLHAAKSMRQIFLVLRLDLCQMKPQRFFYSFRQNSDPVSVALGFVKGDRVQLKINIFYPQSQTFHTCTGMQVQVLGATHRHTANSQ